MIEPSEPDIEATLKFLSTYYNDKLIELEENYTHYANYLRFGFSMDLNENKQKIDENDQNKSVEKEKFILELSKINLQGVLDKSEELFKKQKRKIRTLNRLQLVCQIIVLLCGTAMLPKLISQFNNLEAEIKLLFPLLILLSSIITIITKNMSEPLLGGNKSLNELTNKLMILNNKARYLQMDQLILDQYFDLKRAKLINSKSNMLAQEINLIIKELD